MDYFTNTTESQRLIIARWNLHAKGEPQPREMTDEEAKRVIQENCGDSHVKVLGESYTMLVYMSVDSGIEVIVAIDKTYYDASVAIEVSEVLEAIKA